jgi:hypothetical protein
MYTVGSYRQQLPSIWAYSYSATQGPDAEESNVQAAKAAAHWSERPTLVLMVAASDDFTYEHVPLLPSRTIKTRYRYIGRIPPRDYPLDE